MSGDILQVGATVVAALAALFSFLAVAAIRRQTGAGILLQCLEQYVRVRQDKTRALLEKSPELCWDYFRELFDLHWSEFQLWKRGHIPHDIMEAWLDARWRSFSTENLTFPRDSGEDYTLTYAEAWKKIRDDNYFAASHDFLELMSLTHDGKIKEALRLKR